MRSITLHLSSEEGYYILQRCSAPNVPYSATKLKPEELQEEIHKWLNPPYKVELAFTNSNDAEAFVQCMNMKGIHDMDRGLSRLAEYTLKAKEAKII